MKTITSKIIYGLLAFILMFTCFYPVYATDTIQTFTESTTQNVDVIYEEASSFSVSIPKTITLGSDQTAQYTVDVSGNIASNEIISVIPDSSFTMTDNTGVEATATITQDKTSWTREELGTTGNGTITATGMYAGQWNGSFNLKISLDVHICTPNEDDGSCETAVTCSVCGAETTIALTHTFTDDDDLDCNNVGCAYTRTFTNFTITKSNRSKIGWTQGVTELSIPSTFQDTDGTWYKVTSIGSEAFQYCSTLTNITIPTSVTTINYDAFEKCSSLTSVDIPSSVTTLAVSAFSNCTKLTNISVDPNNTNYCSIDGVVFSKNMETLLQCPDGRTGTYTIPNDVKYIGDYSFQDCKSLTNVEIPSSITQIGYMSFYDCTSLTTLDVPDNVTSIKTHAFNGCSSLTNIDLGSGVTSIGDCVFHNCTSLTSITVDSNNSSYCSMDGVLFNKRKTSIIRCPEGKTGTYMIPDSVTYAYDSALYQCSNLTNVSIPSSLTSISSRMFEKCSNLTNVTIPDNLTYIGSYAFCNCTSLTDITIPAGVTSIQADTFYYCTSLANITIPDNVKTINEYAFCGCKSLTDVIIPNKVTSINRSAFSSCESLKSITLPNSVTKLGDYVFQDCKSLTSIEIPNSLTSIGNQMFYRCTNLTNIIIPNSITSIGNSVFNNCSSLASINYNGTQSQWETITKGSNWNKSTGTYTIYCTDGNITKS